VSNSNKDITIKANKKEKAKNGRFNLIDLILVVLVLLVIAILIQVFSPTLIQKLSSNQTKEIQYTVEFLGVESEFADKIKEEHLVIDSVSKNQIGTVIAINNNDPYEELQYVENSDVGILSPYPNKVNVQVTIKVTADYAKEYGYSVNGTRIAVGEKLSLRFPDYVAEGYCIGLEAE